LQVTHRSETLRKPRFLSIECDPQGAVGRTSQPIGTGVIA
jgi:hypothetical protein